MLDARFLKSIKKRLLDLKAQILSRSYQLSNIPEEEKTDIFDMTSVEKIRDVEHIASSIDVETLKMVEHAIEKIGSGNYGFCEFCGVEIDKERLSEIPYVRYCVDCQEKLELEEHVSKVGTELSESERVSVSDEEMEQEEVGDEKIVEEEGLRVSQEEEAEEEEEGGELSKEDEEIEDQILEEDTEVDKEIKEQVEEEIEEEFRKEEKSEGEEEEFEEEFEPKKWKRGRAKAKAEGKKIEKKEKKKLSKKEKKKVSKKEKKKVEDKKKVKIAKGSIKKKKKV